MADLPSLAPWLSVRDSRKALDFYKAAFGATEVFRIGEVEGPVVARLAIGTAEFWIGEESPQYFNFSPESLGGSTSRMVLSVRDPDAVFGQAVQAGAQEVVPVHEDYGWRLGRVRDPFGHHWEIGRMLAES
jgi:PhnB protein